MRKPQVLLASQICPRQTHSQFSSPGGRTAASPGGRTAVARDFNPWHTIMQFAPARRADELEAHPRFSRVIPTTINYSPSRVCNGTQYRFAVS
jgi:hypothetical protein